MANAYSRTFHLRFGGGREETCDKDSKCPIGVKRMTSAYSPTLLLLLLVYLLLGVGEAGGGVVIENRANDTAVTVSVYDGRENVVLEISLLHAGSVIEWDAKSDDANYSSPWKPSQPEPEDHLFVIKSCRDNGTITSQYFFDDTSVTVVDDSIGGLSVKATGSRGL